MSQSKPAWIIDVDDTNFDTDVTQASQERPVVVDFWAPWCAPCRALTPILEKTVGEHNGAMVLAKVNVDEAREVAARFQVQSIPLVIGFRQGQLVAEFVGVQPEAGIRQFLQQLLPSEADKLVAEADTLANSDPPGAETKYRRALEIDQRHERAILGLARLLIARGADAEALMMLEEIGSSGPQGEAAERLRGTAALHQLARPFGSAEALGQRLQQNSKDAQVRYELGCVQAAQERYPEALEMLLSAGELDPKLAAAKVREAMVAIFHVIGDRSPLADDYRQKLTALLY